MCLINILLLSFSTITVPYSIKLSSSIKYVRLHASYTIEIAICFIECSEKGQTNNVFTLIRVNATKDVHEAARTMTFSLEIEYEIQVRDLIVYIKLNPLSNYTMRTIFVQ